MGVARQDSLWMPLPQTNEARLECTNPGRQRVHGIERVKAHIDRHLVVSAPPRMQLGPRWPDAIRQRLLDVHVDVLKIHTERKRTVRDFLLDLVQAFRYYCSLFSFQDASAHQTIGVRNRRSRIMPLETPIDRDRLAEALHQIRSLFLKSALPHKRAGTCSRQLPTQVL